MSSTKAYYNENDQKPAAWLRELIREGHIAAGEVDERSIEEVTPNDLRGFTQHHFFAGIGGWSYALRLAGWPDEQPVWTGSCPCQPFSAAGSRTGFDDKRHLWPAFFHLIEEYQPAIVFGEQVATKDGLNWLDLVFRLTWKPRVTPLGRRIYALRASARPTQDNASISLAPWITPQTHDTTVRGNVMADNHYSPHDLSNQALLSGIAPTGTPAPTGRRASLNPAHSRWLMGFPPAWDDCAVTAMP